MFISDILKRGVEIPLHEAVALVRDVIERMPHDAVPHLHHVELLPVGRVDVREAELTQMPVERLIDMLRALLAGEATPPQLAMSLAGPLETVDALSDVLAYFERPQRSLILQGLYSRAAAASPLASADELTATLRAAPIQPAETAGGTTSPSVRGDRTLYYAGGILLAAGVVLVVSTALRRGGQDATVASDSSTLAKVSDTVAAAVGSAVSAIGQRVGLSGSPPPPATADVAAPPLEAGTSSATPSGASRSGGVATDRAGQNRGGPPQERSAAESSPLVVREERVVTASDPNTEIVYTSGSPNVTPPVATGFQLPKEAPPGAPLATVTRIQLVILPDGRVDSVRLVGQPHDVLDSMLLSAAKAWQFRPAMKDGVPVKYRTTMSFLITGPR